MIRPLDFSELNPAAEALLKAAVKGARASMPDGIGRTEQLVPHAALASAIKALLGQMPGLGLSAEKGGAAIEYALVSVVAHVLCNPMTQPENWPRTLDQFAVQVLQMGHAQKRIAAQMEEDE